MKLIGLLLILFGGLCTVAGILAAVYLDETEFNLTYLFVGIGIGTPFEMLGAILMGRK